MAITKPYSVLQIGLKYIKYKWRAVNKHAVHSPRIFEFADKVLPSANKQKYKEAEKERKRLKKSKQVLDFVDYGKSGTIVVKAVSEIAKKSLKPPKYARLLGKIVDYYEATNVLELGASLGITTAYLAQNKSVAVTTLEGDSSVANIAQSVWNQLGHTNISCIIGPFEKTLDKAIMQQYDIIYIDGNHKLEPTLRYFDQLQIAAHSGTIFIFDDIHYSKQMEQAWQQIKEDERVTSTIDFFFIGVVFIDPALSKEHLELRY
jgi:predicted O-methyltransferase YrrM